MNKKILPVAVVPIVALGAVLLLSREHTPEPAGQSVIQLAQTEQVEPASSAPVASAIAPDVPSEPAPDTSLAVFADAYENDISEDPRTMFRADAAGNLVVQERTRLNIEKMSALYSPAETRERMAIIESTLPPTAYRQLTDLMQRYDTFMVDMKQTYRPDATPSTVEEVAAQQEGLHAMRIAHFGEADARAMYGKEEQTNRKLLEFMALQKDDALTLDERVHRAQEMLSNSPELLPDNG